MILLRYRICVIMLCVSSACHTWTPAQVPAPGRVLEGNRRSQVRVGLKDGTEMILTNPTLSADTLTGDTRASPSAPSIRISIPTTRILSLEVLTFSPVETAGLIVGLTVLGLAAFVVLVGMSLQT